MTAAASQNVNLDTQALFSDRRVRMVAGTEGGEHQQCVPRSATGGDEVTALVRVDVIEVIDRFPSRLRTLADRFGSSPAQLVDRLRQVCAVTADRLRCLLRTSSGHSRPAGAHFKLGITVIITIPCALLRLDRRLDFHAGNRGDGAVGSARTASTCP